MTTGLEPLTTATKQCGNGACSSWHSNGYHDSALFTDAFNSARRPTDSLRSTMSRKRCAAQREVGPTCLHVGNHGAGSALAQGRRTVARTQVKENRREAIE